MRAARELDWLPIRDMLYCCVPAMQLKPLSTTTARTCKCKCKCKQFTTCQVYEQLGLEPAAGPE